MSIIPSVWGHGLFYIYVNTDVYVIFSNSKCVLDYKREFKESKLDEEEIEEIFLGYRAYLNVSISTAKQELGYNDLLKLMNILEYRTFGMFPFYDEDMSMGDLLHLNIADYNMKETSDFSLEQLHRCIAAGQSIPLTFMARKLVQSRPTNHNDPDASGRGLYPVWEGNAVAYLNYIVN